MGLVDYLKHAWNLFTSYPDRRDIRSYTEYFGSISSSRPDRARLTYSNERSIISSIFTRLCVDISTIDIKHVRTDDKKRYLEDMDSGLNNCLTLEANIDQAARQFRIDVAMTLCDRGVVAIVPVDTSINPQQSGGFDILTLRVGCIVNWYPRHVRVSV